MGLERLTKVAAMIERDNIRVKFHPPRGDPDADDRGSADHRVVHRALRHPATAEADQITRLVLLVALRRRRSRPGAEFAADGGLVLGLVGLLRTS